MKNIKTTILSAALTGCMLLAGTAQALPSDYGTLEAKLTGLSPGLPPAQPNYSGGVFTFDRTGPGPNNTFTGTLTPNSPLGRFFAICLEVNEFISVGSTYDWVVRDVKDGPLNANNLLPNGMGTPKDVQIAQLIGGALAGGQLANALLLSPTYQVALQMAVWEIVYETTTTTPYNVSNGSFSTSTALGIPTYGADQAGAVAQANIWLSNLGNYAAASNLFALTKVGTQDFLVQTVPIPAAAWLLGSGLLGLFGLARRKTAVATA